MNNEGRSPTVHEEPVIRHPEAADEPRWRELWLAYLDYYEAPEYDRRTDRLWEQLLDSQDPFRCRVAELDGQLVGIVHFVEQLDTWYDRPIIYLGDLFVDSKLRGKGIARRLIDEVVRIARENNNPQVYWHTNHDNEPARLLYDKMTGGTSGFIMYEIEIESD